MFENLDETRATFPAIDTALEVSTVLAVPTDLSELDLEVVVGGMVKSPGGVGGPASGAGVRPGVGYGAPGLGMRRGPG